MSKTKTKTKNKDIDKEKESYSGVSIYTWLLSDNVNLHHESFMNLLSFANHPASNLQSALRGLIVKTWIGGVTILVTTSG